MTSILEDAAALTSRDRQAAYGPPLDNFARTAKLWNGILSAKLVGQITAADVGLCMVAVKLAREAHKHARDNLVDIAGYARCTAMVQDDDLGREPLSKLRDFLVGADDES